jgi:uncharacterized membrane protein
MKRRIIKTDIFLFFICLFLVILISVCPTKSVAYAVDDQDLDYTFFEKDYTYIPNDNVESKTYSNEKEGSTHRLRMTVGQFQNIVSIKYHLVKIKLTSDEITYTADDIFLNGIKVTADDIAEIKTIEKSSFVEYENKDATRYGYIDIVAHELCGIVLEVKYAEGAIEGANYSSYIKYVTNIDNSKPTAYYKDWSYDTGKYVFRVTVNGNQLKATQSADSGLRKVVFFQKTGTGAAEKITVLDSTEDISKTPYFYDLKVNPNEKAFYYARVTDWVGNESTNLIVAFGSYDSGFESAVNNALDDLARAEGIYSPHIMKNLSNEFATYGIRVQEFNESDDKITSAAKVEVQKNVIYKLLKEYANIRTLAENGVRDYDLKIINSIYLEGILVGNVNKAYTTLLYGEVANFTIALADFDPRKYDKDAQISASGLKNAERVLSLDLTTTNSQTGNVDITFASPLDIRIPLSDYKSVSAVVEIVDADGNERIEKIEITEYKSYFLIHMPYSKGIVSVVFGEKIISPYYWFFTLAIIPIGIGVFLIISKAKKTKLEKQEHNAKERLENKEKYVPKNKSKKGKKKKK